MQNRCIGEGDLVAISRDHKHLAHARVEAIKPDYKPRWWIVTLYILANPVTVVDWILDDHQLAGADFTMGGVPMRLDLVDIVANPITSSEPLFAESYPAGEAVVAPAPASDNAAAPPAVAVAPASAASDAPAEQQKPTTRATVHSLAERRRIKEAS